jgi:hypothetical protein
MKKPRKCIRCGRKAKERFNVCADGNVWRDLCPPCDVALNALVMDFMRIPDAAVKMVHYITRKGRR